MEPIEIARIIANPTIEGIASVATFKGQWVAKGNYENAAYYRDIEKELIRRIQC